MSEGLNVEKLREAKKILEQNEPIPNGTYCAFYPEHGRFIRFVLENDEVVSAEVLKNGEVYERAE